ncbi:MAG: hypothetical protein QF535_07370, partial [Anaerolineales bacterium]|nr:hypothetical protein [Anaerolineales bacterium]
DNLSVGAREYSSSYAGFPSGYMDEIRISDSARYTSSFTPSTTAFTADSNTKLLIHSDFNGGLGADNSGNKNDYSVTNLVATDQVLDVPTNNFATLNPLSTQSTTLSEGNLRKSTNAAESNTSTIGVSSGKWYWEIYPSTNNWGIGVVNATETRMAYNGATTVAVLYSDITSTGTPNSTETYDNFSSVSAGDIISVALDIDAETIIFYQNNTRIFEANNFTIDGPFFPAVDRGTSATVDITINFGQDSSFAGSLTAQGNQDGNNKGDFYYTPPSGYLALCTDNLDDPSIADPTAHFNTVVYSGNASTRSITGIGFQPDFIWGKQRNGTNAHALVNSVTGNTKYLSSQRTNAEDTQTDVVTSFDSDGFSLGASAGFDMNHSGSNLVAWNWKAGGTASSNTDGSITSSVSANTDAGFSIVGWAGTGSNVTVGHGLSQAPELIINKSRTLNTSSSQWVVQSILWNSASDTNILYLNGTAAQADDTNVFQAAPTATVFSPQGGGWAGIGASGEDYIAYCFHSVDGYSKVGSYTGSGATDGAFVYTGFRPSFVMIKNTGTTTEWVVVDNKRDPYNVTENLLYPDANSAEGTQASNKCDLLSNGFKLHGNGGAMNGANTIIYLAFAESPFKTSNAR